MICRIKAFIRNLNEKGVPLPMIRVNGKPSLTATFAFISFNTAVLGQIGKVTNIIGEVDLSSANYLFFGCLFAWMGKKWTGDGKKLDISDNKVEKE